VIHHLPGFRGLWINRKYSNDKTREGSSSCGEEDNTSEKEEKIKYKILEASLPFVQEHGWTKNAISEGLKLEYKLL
jgi:ubiquinone biosynthesis protein COQ9